MILFRCTIAGNPATKKNGQRLVMVRGRLIPIQSLKHEAWLENATVQVKLAWNKEQRGAPITAPVNVRAHFYRKDRRADTVNLCQALADMLEHAGVLKNDRQIRSWDGTWQAVDKSNPRIYFEIEEVVNG